MASIYRRQNSPYWWIKYRGPDGRIVQESTRKRCDSTYDTHQAQVMAAKHAVSELESRPERREHHWDRWVEAWLHSCYSESRSTLQNYLRAWRNIRKHLMLRGIVCPQQVSYTVCMDYMPWRTKGHKPSGLGSVCQNSARWELGVLRTVMEEAVRRGMVDHNPARSLRIPKQSQREKKEFTDAEIALVREKLKLEPDWMSTCWEIGLYTGARLRQTCLDLDHVDLHNQVIYFHERIKGRPPFCAPIHPQLLPLLQRLKQSGRKTAYDLPTRATTYWSEFFRRIKLGDHCYHGLRVTFVARGARAGVDERAMMRLVNHATTTIHRVYQRYRIDDLRSPLERIPLPCMA